jgi:hypothetical protein
MSRWMRPISMVGRVEEQGGGLSKIGGIIINLDGFDVMSLG